MKNHTRKATVASIALFSCIAAAPIVARADTENPTDPSYLSATEKAYWEKAATTMASASGKVTRESFLQHYSNLWDKHLGADKAPTIERVAEEWVANEATNATDPNYKPLVARKEHVATMDTDHDGTITKDEFMKHMELHWNDAEKSAKAPSMEPSAFAKLMMQNPLDPSYHKR